MGRVMAIPILPGLSLADYELQISYILASGPGGQNVNKVATAAQLRFDTARSTSLPERVRVRLLEIAGSRATRDGVVVITAWRFRMQIRNRKDAIERLITIIREAAHRQAFRIPTRPGRAARAPDGQQIPSCGDQARTCCAPRRLKPAAEFAKASTF